MILFYHRVADVHPNNWTIDNHTFASQIAWIRDRFDIVPLSEAQQRMAADKNHTPTVCITFDDGYAENCEEALPLLLRNNIPFTYFVASRHVLEDLPFPQDVEAGTLLRPNTLPQLRALAQAGVEIGAHTRNHADLGAITDSAQLEDEIVGAKNDLERALDSEMRFFAFPYGRPENMNREAFQIVHEAGFLGACSAYGGYNFAGDDPFHLQRIHADPQMVRLKNWLTMDPRKWRGIERYDPGIPSDADGKRELVAARQHGECRDAPCCAGFIVD